MPPIRDRSEEPRRVIGRPALIATLLGPFLRPRPVPVERMARPNSISETLREVGGLDEIRQVMRVHRTDPVGLWRKIVNAGPARDGGLKRTLHGISSQIVRSVI